MATTTEAKRIPGFVYDDVMIKLLSTLDFMESDVEDVKIGKRSAEDLVDRVAIDIETIKKELAELRWWAY